MTRKPYYTLHLCIFQIKALQPNFFISQLIEVLAEDTASIRGCDNTIATNASTNDTGCYSCTISTYDSEEEDSKDPFSYNTSAADCYPPPPPLRSESPSEAGPGCYERYLLPVTDVLFLIVYTDNQKE